MPNRYNRSSDSTNPSGRSNNPKHIKNTDNESTQYISPNSDNEDTAGFSTSGYDQNRNNQQSPGRRQYYNSQDGKYYRQNYDQYGSQQRYSNRQYNPNGNQQQYSNRQYNPNGSQQQYSNRQYNPNSSQQQYSRQPQNNGQSRPRNSQQRPPANVGYYNGGNGQRQSRQGTPRRSPNGQRPGNRAPQKRPPQNTPPQKNVQRKAPPKNKSRRKHHFLFKIFILILLLLAILFGVYSCTALSLIKKLNYVESGSRSHTAGALEESYVTSILLIGTDGRSVDDRGRSDTMILLSINKKTDEITLTSFMRDSYVDIPGYGWEKLNASYSYGGPELLMDTIEKNFRVRVEDYIAVNFNSFASIIDSVGGIEIEVSDAEAQEINTILMAEVNELMGDARDADLLNSGGKLQLNGKQALSYARIRYIGNADFERTERQRNVLTQVAGKLKSLNPSMISNITKNAVPQITTNMSTSELYLLSLRLPFVIRYDIVQIRVPADGTYGSVTTASGGDALQVDFETNYNLIKDEVFGTN